MPSQANNQLRTQHPANTIQVLEELVERVFRKHRLTARKHQFSLAPTPPPTLRLVMEEFPELQEIIKAVA